MWRALPMLTRQGSGTGNTEPRLPGSEPQEPLLVALALNFQHTENFCEI